MKRVLILGDEHPKVNIVCDLLPPVQKANFRDLIACDKKDAFLKHGDGTIQYSISVDRIEIVSREIPYGTEIKVNFTNSEWTAQIYDQILFIQPYPFTIEEENTELVNLAKYFEIGNYMKCTSCKIVFYHDENQHSGSDDLDDIESVLSNARKTLMNEYTGTFKENMIEFCTYRSVSDWQCITHGASKILNAAIEICSKEYHKWYATLEDLDENYELELIPEPDFLSEEAFLRVKDFSSVVGSESVARKYLEKYKEYFLKQILTFADNFYTESIEVICFWNIEKDINVLNRRICHNIDSYIMKNMPMNVKCPPTKADYNQKICNEMKIDTKFSQSVSHFIREELKDILSGYIRNKMEVLSDAYQIKQ